MAMLRLDVWRQKLTPWLHTLENRLKMDVPTLPTSDDFENLWIQCETMEEDEYEPEQWTLLMEALELLDLLVRVDGPMGWNLLFECMGMDETFMINQATLFPHHHLVPRYIFTAIDSGSLAPFIELVFENLGRMIGEVDEEEPPSPTFLDVKQLLLDVWTSQHHREFDRSREGRIMIKPQIALVSNVTQHPVPFMMEKTFDLARTSRLLLPLDQQLQYPGSKKESVATQQLESRRQRAVFCFMAMDFQLVGNRVTDHVLNGLLSIAKCGLSIDELVLDQVMMPPFHSSGVGTFFWELLSDTKLSRLEYAAGQNDHGTTVSVISSALALSQNLSEFAFTWLGSTVDEYGNRLRQQIDRTAWWPWLAYALFSVDAQHNIQHVKLDIEDLHLFNVAHMRNVLDHPNPLAYVGSLGVNSPELASPSMAVVLKPETKITIGHRRSHDDVCWSSPKLVTSHPYHIVRDNAEEDFLEIMIPGSGVGWIERANVHEIRPLPRRVTHPVVSLELVGMGSESTAAALELLRLVGKPLERLSLCHIGTLDDAFMNTVRTVCPHLKSLDITGELESMVWLTSPSDSSCCLLERLSLCCRFMNPTSVLEFLENLGKGNHEICKSLRYFLYCDGGDPPHKLVPIQELSEPWFEMLRTNRRLERCEFHYHKPSSAIQDFKDRLHKHNGMSILVPEKVAFLSVVTQSRLLEVGPKRQKRSDDEISDVSARYRLSREAIDLILTMANVPQRRICV